MPEPAIANRRAALLAHALPATDRAWLLSELRPDQREVISGLLGELRSMRVPPDPELVRELLEAENLSNHEQYLQQLGADGLARLVQLLRAEPPVLVARFLQARSWPWQDAVLRQLDPQVAVSIREGATCPPAARLQGALVESVAQALQAQRATSSTGRGPWLKPWRKGSAR